MSFTDTANAKKYASIAETAAAQAKLYANELAGAPDYAAQAAASATAAAASAQAAVSAESVVNNLANSASASATEAAASAADAGNAAAAAVGQCLRVPEGESVDVLPVQAGRLDTFLTFDSAGNTSLLPKDDVAILDSEGKIPVSMIPAVAISEIFVVNSQAAMLALDVQVGDIAKRTDIGLSFALAAEPASTLSNWIQLNDDVLAQLGLSTGATEVGAVDDSSNPTTVQGALNLKAPLTALTAKLNSADLAASDGFKLVGRCATVATLRTTEPTINKQMVSLVEYTTGTGYGGGILWYDNTDTTSADNGVDVFVTTGGKRWKRLSSRITLLDAGGVPGTDSSIALQRLVDAKKGKLVIVPDGEFIYAGVTLNGSTYNNTQFLCEGVLKLKQRASYATTPVTYENNFGGGFVGLVLKDVFNVSGHLRLDGQRAVQPNEEHIYCVGIAGGGGFDYTGSIKEIRGDGFYISQSDWLSNSTITDGFMFKGTITNTSLDGRNAISVISCNNFKIDATFENVGGVVGGNQQPGGIDFEPNFDYQTITNGMVDITASSCNYGVCIFGKSYNVKNVSIRATLSACNPYLSRWRDCNIDIGVDNSTLAGNIDTCIGGSVVIRHSNCTNGVDVGWRGEVTNCGVKIVGDLWTNYVCRTGKIKGGSLRWEAYNCVSGGTGIALRIDTPQDGAAYTIVGTTFSCCVPYDSVVQYAARNAGGLITFSQCGLGNSNLATWSNWGAAVSGQLANVRDSNTVICNGFSTSTAQPGVGYYVAGDFVKANTFTIASGKVQLGWLRITTGSAHVAGTDWTPFFGTTS